VSYIAVQLGELHTGKTISYKVFNDDGTTHTDWTTGMTEIGATGTYEKFSVSLPDSGTIHFSDNGGTTVFACVAEISDTSNITEILADTTELQANQGNWLTATGFATPTNVTDAQTAIITTTQGLITALHNLSAADVWNYGTRTLTSFGTLIADIWNYATRTITSGGITASEIWNYATRTLTNGATAEEIVEALIDAIDYEPIPSKTDFTYTVTSSLDSSPISGVKVWIATDALGNNVVWDGLTGEDGIARSPLGYLPSLDPGTYYVFRSKTGWVFNDPDTEVI